MALLGEADVEEPPLAVALFNAAEEAAEKVPSSPTLDVLDLRRTASDTCSLR